MKKSNNISMHIADLVGRANLPRDMVPVWEQFRVEAFRLCQEVYDDRAIGLNVDHPPYEEMVFGPVSLASEIFKRSRRLAALLSPMRKELLRTSDINRILDLCIDQMNYLSWTYALVILATGEQGHDLADDSPNYVGIQTQVMSNGKAKRKYTKRSTPKTKSKAKKVTDDEIPTK